MKVNRFFVSLCFGVYGTKRERNSAYRHFRNSCLAVIKLYLNTSPSIPINTASVVITIELYTYHINNIIYFILM